MEWFFVLSLINHLQCALIMIEGLIDFVIVVSVKFGDKDDKGCN